MVVCCYNSVDRLPMTLKHLAQQRVPDDLPWEVIVVDNASTDATATVAQQLWHEFGSTGSFRVVAQSIPGLTAAREMGEQVAKYAFVVFCDDDNWLADDYVSTAYEALRSRPRAGLIGGQGSPVIAGDPPPWFERYARSYALGPQGVASGDVSEAKGYVYGAGFVLRRSAWDDLRRRGFVSQLTGRKGTALSSSEDRELCYALRLLGYEVHYVEDLRFQHEIPARRLSWNYFLKMVEMANRTTPVMDAYLDALRGMPPLEPAAARRIWWQRCGAIAFAAIRRPRALLVATQRHRVTHGAVQWRRWRGAWTGWRQVGSRYADIQAAVHALRKPALPPD